MIRVMIVDDQALVRSGFRVILETEPGIEVVGEASNGEEAVDLAAQLQPDVICMDVEMPVMDGIEASRQILASNATSPAEQPNPSPSILVLTTFGHEEYVFDALEAGVSGFLLKTARAEQLIDAVRTLASGQALLGADITRIVMERAAGRDTEAARSAGVAERSHAGNLDPGAGAGAIEAAGLTEREREVLSFVARGQSNAEIASALFVGESTVKTHVSNLLQKIGARDRIQLVVWAHSHGVSP